MTDKTWKVDGHDGLIRDANGLLGHSDEAEAWLRVVHRTTGEYREFAVGAGDAANLANLLSAQDAKVRDLEERLARVEALPDLWDAQAQRWEDNGNKLPMGANQAAQTIASIATYRGLAKKLRLALSDEGER